MKKIIIVLFLLFAATVVFAQAIDLGAFPAGKWVDSKYNATWEFSKNSIKVTDNKTGESFNFAGQIQNLKLVDGGRSGVGLTFSSSAAGRDYTVTPAAPPSLDLTMVIKRAGLPDATLTLKKQ